VPIFIDRGAPLWNTLSAPNVAVSAPDPVGIRVPHAAFFRLGRISTSAEMPRRVPLASLWLVPKLPRFVRLHPEVDVRSVAADQRLDVERERLDIAIRWAPSGSSVPGGEPLFNVEMFPVCSPALASDRARPLRTPADLASHVLLDLETVTSRGPWSDWGPWLGAMKLGDLKPAGTLRFSHYDQVVQAAIDGSGVAIGRNPHNARHLREGLLVEPFGREARLSWGTYLMLISPRSAERRVIKEFVAWLRDEIRRDGGADASAEALLGVVRSDPQCRPRRAAPERCTTLMLESIVRR
jgi:DNA-binding transcriptional LysR family regulator